MTDADRRAHIYSEAQRYVDAGISVVPVHPQTKRPIIAEWKTYQTRLPTEDELEQWFGGDANVNVAIVTGAISGVLAIDADSEEAIAACEAAGVTSPCSARTGRGRHYYFAHPGYEVRNSHRWRGMNGVDVRGDGGYIVAPPSLHSSGREYRWVGSVWLDEVPPWPGEPQAHQAWTFEQLDLTGVRPDGKSWWEVTQSRVATEGKLREGDGRNTELTRYVGELVRQGFFGDALADRIEAFQEAFFDEYLPVREVEKIVRSISERDRRNHPEDYLPDGSRRPTATASPLRPRVRPVFYRDMDEIRKVVESRPVLISPWLGAETAVQLHSWTGAGKSLWGLTMMWHLALGKSLGPYAIPEAKRVLYCDWENGARTIVTRSEMLRRAYGDPGDNLMWWSPALDPSLDVWNLRDGFEELAEWVMETAADVVVIDTIRTAYSGLEENRGEAWAPMNELILSLRRAGRAVILMHHSNKPSDRGLGREAGHAAQLANIEVQIKLTAIYADEELARDNAGIHDPEAWEDFCRQVGRRGTPKKLITLTYGKVRDYSDDFKPRRIGWYRDPHGIDRMHIMLSPRERAIEGRRQGYDIPTVAQALGVTPADVARWLSEDAPDLL